MPDAPMRYVATARFDDGLYEIRDNAWVKIGPPNPPCTDICCRFSLPRIPTATAPTSPRPRPR